MLIKEVERGVFITNRVPTYNNLNLPPFKASRRWLDMLLDMLDIGNISPKKSLMNQLLYMPTIGNCVEIQTSPWWTDVTLRGEHRPSRIRYTAVYPRPYYGYGMPVSVSVQWFQEALTVWDGCVYGRKRDLRDLTVLTSINCEFLC